METRNIMVVGVWAFVIVWLIGMLALGGDLLIAIVLFFVAMAISVAATILPTKSIPETKPVT